MQQIEKCFKGRFNILMSDNCANQFQIVCLKDLFPNLLYLHEVDLDNID